MVWAAPGLKAEDEKRGDAHADLADAPNDIVQHQQEKAL
jgi:hypothetical protein